MVMPLDPTWSDIAIRLVLTMLAGAVIGFDRGVRGHAAGFRTTILVALAASLAMILANVLLSVGGKVPDSFAAMDVMRLPLGILTGVGFIGGGTILKRGDLVAGVTTAATPWLMTVVGLCLGAGQLALGIAATALAAITLWALKWIDIRIPRDHRAALVIATDLSAAPPPNLDSLLRPLGYRATFRRQSRRSAAGQATVWYDIHWTRPETAGPALDVLAAIARPYTVDSFEIKTDINH